MNLKNSGKICQTPIPQTQSFQHGDWIMSEQSEEDMPTIKPNELICFDWTKHEKCLIKGIKLPCYTKSSIESSV